MNSQLATEIAESRTHRSVRSLLLLALGPVASFGGVAWAFFQPHRVTLLHPHGQGFWWLVVEPPLLVILAGVLFHLLVAPGIVADLEETE